MVVVKAIIAFFGIVTLIGTALLARSGDPDFHVMVPIFALALLFALLDFARR